MKYLVAAIEVRLGEGVGLGLGVGPHSHIHITHSCKLHALKM